MRNEALVNLFSTLWRDKTLTYKEVAQELNKTRFRLKSGESWDNNSVGYFALKVLKLKGERRKSKQSEVINEF